MSETRDLLTQLELAIEREQALWENEDNTEMKSVHSALAAFRNALNETLEEE